MLENYFEENIEELAGAVHEYYRQLGKKEGWTMEYDMAYADLPDEIKGDNLLTLEGYRECKPCRVECRDRG
jgi:hypothetical protein